MSPNTLKLVITEVHVVVGLAAVATLVATGHMDGTTGAGFIGGLLGLGVAPPLVAYHPALDTPTGAQPVSASQTPTTPTGAAPSIPPAPPMAQTPATITGTGTQPAMPQQAG